MSDAEYFLVVWAILSTVFAVYYNHRYKLAVHKGALLVGVMLKMSMGKLEPKRNSDGTVTIEDDGIKMTIKEVDE